jgi:hypothetical protein
MACKPRKWLGGCMACLLTAADGVCVGACVRRLKGVSGSQGLMLEGTSPTLTAAGGPHWNCPDKEPRARLDTLAAAGKARVPFTSGGQHWAWCCSPMERGEGGGIIKRRHVRSQQEWHCLPG